ncbi:hypothetical protein ACOWMP_07650 [Helicobacter pylori]
MRSVVFDVSGVLEAFDYRGVLIHAQEIEANQKLKLPFTQKNTNKQEVLNHITQEKTKATSEITEAKKAIIIKTLIFLRLNKAC